MAIFDTLGVASIIPFIAVLVNTEIIETNIFLFKLYGIVNKFNITTKEQFLILLGIFLFIILILSIAFKALTIYYQTKFTLMREYSIGMRILKTYLQQPYSWYLSRHSSDFSKVILSEVNQLVYQAIVPAMNLITLGMVAVGILLLLIIFDPKIAVIVFLVLGCSYFMIYKMASNYLVKIGEIRSDSNRQRFLTLGEIFGAIKQIKINNLENNFQDKFESSAKVYAEYQVKAQIIGQIPRFAIEAIVFGGMLLLILYLMNQYGSFETIAPVISLYIVAGYRLMPILQQIYISTTQLRYSNSLIDVITKELTEKNNSEKKLKENILKLKKYLKLIDIDYTYPNKINRSIKKINLTIKANTTVAIIGKSGCGKTTLLDIISGLLIPQNGFIEIDGEVINKKNLTDWQTSIGYVPQDIYLINDTIIANIAFGIKKDVINIEMIENAAKIANLHNFITQDLPNKYLTIIGERGVGLSGGQKQKIAIARAIYRNPQIMVFDESTNALDTNSEKEVMESINNLNGKVTTLIVNHRLSNLKNVDNIFIIDEGKLIASGSYLDLLKDDVNFSLMVSSEENIKT